VQGAQSLAVQPHLQSEPQTIANNNLNSLRDIMALLEQHGAMNLASQLYHFVSLVKCAPLRLDFVPVGKAPPSLAQDLKKKLTQILGQNYMVTVSAQKDQAEPTLAEQDQTAKKSLWDEVASDPAVAKILHMFPNSKILSIDNQE
jgi:hypothetical protein